MCIAQIIDDIQLLITTVHIITCLPGLKWIAGCIHAIVHTVMFSINKLLASILRISQYACQQLIYRKHHSMNNGMSTTSNPLESR